MKHTVYLKLFRTLLYHYYTVRLVHVTEMQSSVTRAYPEEVYLLKLLRLLDCRNSETQAQEEAHSHGAAFCESIDKVESWLIWIVFYYSFLVFSIVIKIHFVKSQSYTSIYVFVKKCLCRHLNARTHVCEVQFLICWATATLTTLLVYAWYYIWWRYIVFFY